ncbi:hypothetical protein [Spirosoma aerolatum]|uniref:hypothetical protein n=1 Tax=Spirosoma aerolatum TaxID=1211326 RepID=UPI0012D34276|nr:hypothetical protein [Spirosoma aerolatum]
MKHLFTVLWLFCSSAGAQTSLSEPNRVFDSGKEPTDTLASPVPNRTRLIKAGLTLPLFRQSSFAPTWLTAGLQVGMEQKMKSGFALVGRLETNYSFQKGIQLYTVEMPLGVRYYFSVGRHMRQRADRHSFFSHYVAFQTHNVLFANAQYNQGYRIRYDLMKYSRGQMLDHIVNEGEVNESFYFLQYGYFQVGSQLQLGVNKYLDIDATIPISPLIHHRGSYTLSTPSLVTIRYGLFW